MAPLTAGDVLLKALKAETVTEGDLRAEVTGCYVSDLLSDVLAKSKEGDLWITQHTHSNIVAVASVKGLSAVVVVGDNAIADETLEKARSEAVTLARCSLSAFEAAGEVYNLLKGGSGQGH